jgi:ubiquinol-cytochrome c reductase cytochrome b subunit
LRSIPNKLLGVIAMFAALVAIAILPITDLGKSKGLQFRSLSKIGFYIFVANFLILLTLGAKHVESPFIEFGQISTCLYFSYFVIIMPIISISENTLMDLTEFNRKKTNDKL